MAAATPAVKPLPSVIVVFAVQESNRRRSSDIPRYSISWHSPFTWFIREIQEIKEDLESWTHGELSDPIWNLSEHDQYQ